MDILLHRLDKAAYMIPEAEESARLLRMLSEQLAAAKFAEQAMQYMHLAALTRGYDSICAAIEAAPLKSNGRGEW